MRELKLWVAYAITVLLVNTTIIGLFATTHQYRDVLMTTIGFLPILLPIDLYLGTWFGVDF